MNRFLNKYALSCALITLLASCQSAPRVIADLEGNYPSRKADSVIVYEVGKPVPAEARAIGKVKVTDGGITPTDQCLYGNMLALAVKKTAESGGNVLRIDEHKAPSRWTSTCHRIWGTMMLMPDSLVTTDSMTSLQEIEMNRDKELAEMAKEQISTRDKIYNNPKNILRVNAGPAWITSEIETYAQTYKRKSGFAASVDYQHYWKYGLGLGTNYSFYHTSFDEGFNANIHYIGPSILYAICLGSKWRMDMALGLGYANYTESISSNRVDLSTSESGLGSIFQLGIEYRLTDRLGIGLHANGLTMRLKKPEGYEDKYDFYGIKRFDALLGLRVYL